MLDRLVASLIDQTQKQRRRHLRDSLHLVNNMKVTFDIIKNSFAPKDLSDLTDCLSVA